MKIKDFNPLLRPYEKCLRNGPSSLTDEELLAMIIRCGTRDEDSVSLSKRILSLENHSGGLLNIIEIPVKELLTIHGIGKVKALQIKCIGELSKRIAKQSYNKNMCFTTAKAVADYYMEELRHLRCECLKALFLDSACQFIYEMDVSKGTVNASIASPREVFIEAVRYEAVNIILIHNHPSGNPSPSAEDINITRSMMQAGQMLGIHVIDHIIIGDNKYISLREKGIIQEEQT